MPPLTTRQADVLKFIEKHIDETGFSPNLDTIAKGLGLASRATVQVHIKNLENAGRLKRAPFETRQIVVIDR